MRLIKLFLSSLLLAGLASSCQKELQNWTHFRGNNLDGITLDSGFPQSWNDSTNISWKAEIPGRGWSSPVVFGDQVWCTSAPADGKEMYAYCLDFETGKQIYSVKLFEPDTVYRKHSINSYATPTPCIEEGYVYVHFGRYGTACLSTENGEVIWKRNDLQCRHVQGPGSSPILYQNMLILHMEGTDVRYLIALDKATGETIWKADRPEELFEDVVEIGRKSYTTPIIINVGGKDLLISLGSAVCMAYEPETGNEVWRVDWGAESCIAMPAEHNGKVYFYAGFEVYPDGEQYSELFCINPDGKGNITETNILWRMKSPRLQLASPIIREDLLYTIDSKSNLQCIDAETGQVVWTEKLKGKYNSSLSWADGLIYFSSTRGDTYVIREGRSYQPVSENSLQGEIWATPAFLRNSILLRTSEYLYKITEGD